MYNTACNHLILKIIITESSRWSWACQQRRAGFLIPKYWNVCFCVLPVTDLRRLRGMRLLFDQESPQRQSPMCAGSLDSDVSLPETGPHIHRSIPILTLKSSRSNTVDDLVSVCVLGGGWCFKDLPRQVSASPQGRSSGLLSSAFDLGQSNRDSIPSLCVTLCLRTPLSDLDRGV